jgi:hypothetical protein
MNEKAKLERFELHVGYYDYARRRIIIPQSFSTPQVQVRSIVDNGGAWTMDGTIETFVPIHTIEYIRVFWLDRGK